MSQIVADSLLLLVTVIWGTTFVVVKEAISAIKPFTFIAVRFFIGGIFLLVIVLLRAYAAGKNSRNTEGPASRNAADCHALSETGQSGHSFMKGSVVTGIVLFLAYATPVSYTHLDVYKRQLTPWIGTKGITSVAPILGCSP